jgi:serine O-acetyltransferase
MNSMGNRLPSAPVRSEQPIAAVPAAGIDEEVLWRTVRSAAQEVALREPLLRQRLQALVLDQKSLPAATAAVLARRLACGDMPEAGLRTLMQDIAGEDAALAAHLVGDLAAVKERDPACSDHLHVLLNLKGFQALQSHRFAHALWQRGRVELAHALANQASVVFAVDIHPAARIGSGVMLDHGTGIVIGETTVIDDNVSILQNVTLGGTGKEHGDRHPKIRSGVMIGAGAKILGNIVIGTMSKVAAGSVVLREVPPHCTVAGVPARVVRHHRDDSCPSEEMDQTI